MNSGTSLVMNTPAGTQQNDLMLVVLGYNTTGGTITAPSGWTLTSTNGSSGSSLWSYRRIAGASEPASYTWTISAAISASAWEGSYIGVDTTTPVDVINGSGESGTTHTTPSVTTTVANDLIIAAYSVVGIATLTTPTGMAAEGTVTVSPTNPNSLAVFDTIQSNAGATGGKATTSSVSSQSANQILTFKAIASNTVTLGSATTTLGSIASPTLSSISIATSAATFTTGERLVLEVSVPNDVANCGVRLSYDEASVPSKLTVATIVPEGLLGLLLLAPALPFGARWWKRRRR
jgi:hypothetical protein